MDISTPPTQIEDHSYCEYKNENIGFEQNWISNTIEKFNKKLTLNRNNIPIDEIAMSQNTITFQNKNNTSLPSIIFVSNIHDKKPINNYSDLPKLQLNEDEQIFVDKKETEISRNGKHILLSSYQFDSFSNKIYLEAKQATYAQLQCLRKGEIKNDYTYYQTGVIAPLICNDKKILFLKRDDFYQLWSSPSGFMKPINDQIGGENFNLVEKIAFKKIENEALTDKFSKATFLTSDIALSIRFILTNKLPVAEFIVPIYVDYSSDQVKKIIEKEYAKNKSEHVSNQYWTFDFSDKKSLKSSIQEFGAFSKRGWFLYWPVLETLFPKETKNIQKPNTLL